MSKSGIPCPSFEKDGCCIKGSRCPYEHALAIQTNFVEFLFEYETIPSSKARKIKRSEVSSSTPSSRKSKKVKPSELKSLNDQVPDLTKDDTLLQPKEGKPAEVNQVPTPNVPKDENYVVPKEFSNVDFEKPTIPFDFGYHTPTFVRQKTLNDLIEFHKKITLNRKKQVVLSLQKGKLHNMLHRLNMAKEMEFYLNSHEKALYLRNYKKYAK